METQLRAKKLNKRIKNPLLHHSSVRVSGSLECPSCKGLSHIKNGKTANKK